jgi:hypothetical protein
LLELSKLVNSLVYIRRCHNWYYRIWYSSGRRVAQPLWVMSPKCFYLHLTAKPIWWLEHQLTSISYRHNFTCDFSIIQWYMLTIDSLVGLTSVLQSPTTNVKIWRTHLFVNRFLYPISFSKVYTIPTYGKQRRHSLSRIYRIWTSPHHPKWCVQPLHRILYIISLVGIYQQIQYHLNAIISTSIRLYLMFDCLAYEFPHPMAYARPYAV